MNILKKIYMKVFNKICYISETYKIEDYYEKLGVNKEKIYIGRNNEMLFLNNIYIDDYCCIGNRNRIYAQAPVHIKSGTFISDNVEIRTANHHYDGDDLKMLPFDEIAYCKPVIIEENCWIGSSVIILPGVTIHEGAIIGAGAVISSDVPKFAVVVGNPSHIVKFRNKEKYYELKKENKIFMINYKTIKRQNVIVDRK